MIEEAKKLNIHSTCITFDQPLWQKAIKEIKEITKELGMVMGIIKEKVYKWYVG